MRRHRTLVPVALAAGLLCLAAGCGKDASTPSVPQTGNVPTTLPEPTTTTAAAAAGAAT